MSHNSNPVISHVRSLKFSALGCAAALALASWAQAQTPFDCGSTGSYGPMNITENTTLQMPPDGIFNCTTVNIASGVTVKFGSNPLNTPVYILATGDVTIGGTLDVSGQQALAGTAVLGGLGGPGGFAGGSGYITSYPVGSGYGPGGGSGATSGAISYAGDGSYRFSVGGTGAGATYGNSLLIPLVGGSGGGGSNGNLGRNLTRGGGGGGGAILVASNTRIVFPPPTNGVHGRITARGGLPSNVNNNAYSGAGSGGAIRLVSPIVTGTGSFSISCPSHQHGEKPNGRFRIDSYDLTSFSIPSTGSDSPDATGTIMIVFPETLPKLSVVSVAGTTVSEDATSAIYVNLPTGSPATQTVRVRARDFGVIVPIRVRLVPETGNAATFDGAIDNTTTNPAEAAINVTMPLGVTVNVQVYTR